MHFNLHFDSDQKNRLFAKEVEAVLEESLVASNAIPEIDISSLEIHGMCFMRKSISIQLQATNFREEAAIVSEQEKNVSRRGRPQDSSKHAIKQGVDNG